MTERLGEAVLDLRADSSRFQSDLRAAEGHVKRSGGIMQTALGFAGGALIDPINRTFESSSAGYFTLYGLTLIGFLLATLAVLRMPKAAFFTAQPIE